MNESLHKEHQPIIIAGMHRSGTSLTASILEKAGIPLGETLLGSQEGNSRGHYEDVNFLALHQNILMSHGICSEGWTDKVSLDIPQQFWEWVQTTYMRRIEKGGIWGWKEPRTVLFLNAWEQFLPTAKFIFVYRSPWEVVESLFSRGDFAFINNPKFALDVWMAYNTAIINFCQTRPQRTFLFHVDNAKSKENALILSINEKLGIHLKELQETLFEPDQMHTEVSGTHRPTLLSVYFPEALALYEKLEQLADLRSHAEDRLPVSKLPHDAYHDWVFQDWSMNKRLTILLNRNQTELQQLKEEQERSQAESQQIEQAYERSQGELQQLTVAAEQSQANLQQKQDEVGQLHTELQQKQQELDQFHAELQQKQHGLDQLHAELQQKQHGLDQLHAELQQKQQELDQLYLERNDLQSELQQSQQDLEKLTEELTIKSEKLQLSSEQARTEVNSLKTQLTRSGDELGHSRAKVQQLQAELEAARDDFERSQAELQKVNMVLEQAKNEAVQSSAIVAAMESSKFWKLRRVWIKLTRRIRSNRYE